MKIEKKTPKIILSFLFILISLSCQSITTDIFTDSSFSKLKPKTTQAEIDKLGDSVLKAIAKQLLDGTYPTSGRVREYKPYTYPNQSKTLKIADFGLLDNPTGIWMEPNEELIIYTGDLYGEKISVTVVSDYSWGKLGGSGQQTFSLKNGTNRFKVRDGGLVYVLYHDSKSKNPVKLHFASGKVNGFFDITRHSEKDWKKLLEEAPGTYLDVLGKRVHLCFPVKDFKTNCLNSGKQMIQVWDSIVLLQQQLIGLEKYKRIPENRILCVMEKNPNWFMYAGDGRTAYVQSSFKDILRPNILRSKGVWGPAHEIGHMYQTRPGLRWIGTIEVTNNIHSLYVQTTFGNKSRLEEEHRYDQGLNHIVVHNRAHVEDNDPFRKLVPFWQLYLYSKSMGYKDYYADLYEQVRNEPDKKYETQSGAIQLDFVKNTCNLMKVDFSDFFKAWGFLREIDKRPEKNEHFLITPNELAEAEKYIKEKKYTKAPAGLVYLTDYNYSTFVRKAPVIAGRSEREGNNVSLEKWKNVMAFEIYEGDKLVQISTQKKFRLFKPYSDQTHIKAIAWDGKATKVTLI